MASIRHKLNLGKIEISNQTLDVPTYCVDGIKGVMVGKEQVKFSFFEACVLPTEDVVKGRFVANISMSRSQFIAMREHLAKIDAESILVDPEEGEDS